MFDHIGLRTPNFEKSVAFYRAALAPLGYGLVSLDDGTAGFGPDGEAALWLHAQADGAGSSAHLAFRAATHDAVDAFHAAAVAAGGRDHGLPGLRADYGPTYYAAFVADPDGNNVEAVCLEAAG